MNGALAVLGRITEIETRFRGAPPVSALDTPFDSDAAAGFAAAYDVASAQLSSSGSADATSLATWTGIGGSGWVYPGVGVPLTSPAGSAGSVAADVPYAALFESAGARHGVPAELLAAVGWVESRYETDAVSPAGAQGVMQLMPFVSQAYGVDPWNPAQAIDAAARILSEHHARFGSWDLALAAYNAGAGAVARAGNRAPSPAVAGYVTAVNERVVEMQAGPL